MWRTALPHTIAVITLASLSWSPFSSSRTALKNGLQVRVTSVTADPVNFAVVRRQGVIAISKSPRPATDSQELWIGTPVLATVHSVTPRDLLGSDGEFVFIAAKHQRIRVEAWRLFGETQHVVAEGQAITVRAAGGVPQVMTDSLVVVAPS